MQLVHLAFIPQLQCIVEAACHIPVQSAKQTLIIIREWLTPQLRKQTF